ncbi:MAG: hypothetical protein HKP03_07935 [Xanthomonadales bacterium]|nr:hypothetical protein [Gammaproteobacteria bacterium]NNK32533.1 hypothetical protein [Xanthomonadales bacterium]NNK38396.1 hypothetical protein [Xanthomonadales bacterium]
MSGKSRDPGRRPAGDSELDRALEKIGRAWKREPGPEPPELVDLAVLNRARREALAGKRGRRLRWLGGLATAAVVVLTLSVVVRQDQRPDPAPGPVADGLQIEASRRDREESETLPERLQEAPEAISSDPAPQPAESIPVAPAKRALQETDAAAALSKETADRSPKIEEKIRRESLLRAASTEAETLSDRADEDEETAGAEGVLSPEAWIERLLQLKERGQAERLAREIAGFREAYPDHPLPPGLEP